MLSVSNLNLTIQKMCKSSKKIVGSRNLFSNKGWGQKKTNIMTLKAHKKLTAMAIGSKYAKFLNFVFL